MPNAAFTYPETEPLIVFDRIFAAPRELVWRAHTDPAMIGQWWGPRYLRNEVLELDVRPGGAWRINQHAPDGVVHPFSGVYSVVSPPERLDYTFAYADYDPVPITLRLEDLGDGRTRMISVTDMGSMEARKGMLDAGMESGALEGYERLDTLLGQEKLVIVRRFKAPRALIWKAYTELDRLAAWWGPEGFTWLEGTVDLRPGGLFHFGMAAPDGSEMWAKFTYHDIRAPERLAYTVAFSDRRGTTQPAGFDPNFPDEFMNIVTLKEEGDETVLTLEGWAVSEDPAQLAAYAAMIPNMQQGFGGTFGQLDAYLAKEQGQ
jgi:uncharacterized protein YndB with AHSA1/START domain